MQKDMVFALNNGFIVLNSHKEQKHINLEHISILATIINNLASMGYKLTHNALVQLSHQSDADLKSFWKLYEPPLKEKVGDAKRITSNMVYKNFPNEVLEMSEAQYWFQQILMYWGIAEQHDFSTPIEQRETIEENIPAIVLDVIFKKELVQFVQNKLDSLFASSKQWNAEEFEQIVNVVKQKPYFSYQQKVSEFKLNYLALIAALDIPLNKVNLPNPIDVLRLFFMKHAVNQSYNDWYLAGKISSFKAIKDGICLITYKKRKPSQEWLKLVHRSINKEDTTPFEHYLSYRDGFMVMFNKIKVKEYPQYKKAHQFYKLMYSPPLTTTNGILDKVLADKNISEMKDFVANHMGLTARNFNRFHTVFGKDFWQVFVENLDKLPTQTVVDLAKYLETHNQKDYKLHFVKPTWSKIKFDIKHQPKVVSDYPIYAEKLWEYIGKKINKWLDKNNISHVVLDTKTAEIKLADNRDIVGDGKNTQYGAGTVFDLPKEMKFLRLVSYWHKQSEYNNIWADNSVMFITDEWGSIDACCWDNYRCLDSEIYAIFSGDPTTSSNNGKAATMIDVYLDKLPKNVRYVMWLNLSYNNIPFNTFIDAEAHLQYGVDALKNNVFDPKRTQLTFNIASVKGLTNYHTLIDVKERKIYVLNMDLGGSVHSASSNVNHNVLHHKMMLAKKYIDNKSSWHDVFSKCRVIAEPNVAYNPLFVLYSDINTNIPETSKRLVLLNQNEQNHADSDKYMNMQDLFKELDN